MRGGSLVGILAVAALALNPSLVTAKSKGQSQKLSPSASRQTTNNSFSNKTVQGSGNVVRGKHYDWPKWHQNHENQTRHHKK